MTEILTDIFLYRLQIMLFNLWLRDVLILTNEHGSLHALL